MSSSGLFILKLGNVALLPQLITAGFNAPDTVCVNAPVNITNTSTGATNYYWNFCVAGASTTIPTGASIGSFNPPLNITDFMDYAFDGTNYYGFVTNNTPAKLVRLDFGNSLLNTPVAVDLGNFGGVVPLYAEGIQIVKNEGNWYALIVGGQPGGSIINLNFGASLSNLNPVATNWGNIGNLSYPHDLHVFQDGANWYGFTVNATSNTVTRFNFTNSFSNTPTGVNLGNLGNLDFPTGIYAINDNTNWHVFITSATGTGNNPGTSLTRLDFGNSLLNTPTGVNLGNLGVLRTARDLTIYKSCDEIIGYIVNYSATNDIVRLNFNNNLTATPTATSIGNIGNLDFPVCLTKIFRVNNDLYSFITNANTNAISRLKFSGCSNSSIPSSTAATPPAITYNTPGTYYINLTIDEGLATQQSFCRQIVVKNCSVAIVPDCSPGRFYGIGSDYKLYAFTIANDSVIYNGAIAGDTFNVHPGSLGIARLDSAMCFYSNSNTNSTLLQLKNNWESIHGYNGGIYNAGGQDSFLYYHTFGGGQNILRYNGVSLSTTYFGANAIFQDIAVDSIGNVYFLSDNGGNSSILRKISPTGVVVDNDTIAVGGYNGFGCFIMGNVLYLGYGSSNAYHPNTLIPVTLNSTAPVVGNPIRMPSQPLIADLASCAKVNVQLPCTNPPAAPTVWVTQSTCATPTGTIIITSSPGLTYSINGVTYDTTTTFTGVASGSYNVTAQNSSGCTSAATVVTIIQPGIPPAPTLAITQPNCTSPTGTITVTTPIGATFTYSIDGVDYSNTTGVFTGVAQGTYNITVKTGGGCLSPATTGTINAAPAVPPAPTITVTQPTCTTPTGTITITPTAGFTYSINGTTYDTTTVFTGVAPGSYNVTAQISGGCVSAATVVTINAAPGTPPAPTFIITQPNCTSFTGTITITAPLGAGLTYSIDGVTYTNISGIFTGIAQGAYNVTVKTGGGCLSTITTATINAAPPVPPAPTVTVTQPTCTTPTGTITITSPPGLTYSINGTTYDTTTIYTGVAPGSYNLTAQISGGCVSAATVVIINAAPGTPPAPTLAITQPNCTSSTGTITITAPIGAAFTYSIDGVDYTNTTGVFAGVVPGSYNVNVRNSSGCTSTATVAVINTDPVIPPAPTVAITQPSCLVSSGTITITFPIAGATTYSIDGATYVPNNVFSGVAPGTYNVTISNGSCISTGTVATVNAIPALLLTLTATPNPVSAGSTVTFTVTGNTPFTVTGWQPVANFPNQSATTQTIVVNTPLTAIVSGTRADNCMDTAEVSVTQNSVDDVWLPNTFTPNRSGLNDILYVYGSSIDKLQFTIWNQWGEKIFTTSNKAEGWDGTSKGKPQPVGVYVYVAKAVLFNGKEVMKKGAVNLIR